jgi:hypothetical protein
MQQGIILHNLQQERQGHGNRWLGKIVLLLGLCS